MPYVCCFYFCQLISPSIQLRQRAVCLGRVYGYLYSPSSLTLAHQLSPFFKIFIKNLSFFHFMYQSQFTLPPLFLFLPCYPLPRTQPHQLLRQDKAYCFEKGPSPSCYIQDEQGIPPKRMGSKKSLQAVRINPGQLPVAPIQPQPYNVTYIQKA